jgi:hypothetical protein
MSASHAIIEQYSNDPRWYIRLFGPLPNPKKEFDLEDCPGSLYQDYYTAEEAMTVAQWWGYSTEVGRQ